MTSRAPMAGSCAEAPCNAAAQYICKVCGVTLCLEHAHLQENEPGWLCGSCAVMPKARQAYWAEVTSQNIATHEFAPLWSPFSDDFIPDYTERPGDDEEFGDEEDFDGADDWDDGDAEEEGEEDDFDDDDEIYTPSNRYDAYEETERDYEMEGWRERELERDLYDDDDFDADDEGGPDSVFDADTADDFDIPF